MDSLQRFTTLGTARATHNREVTTAASLTEFDEGLQGELDTLEGLDASSEEQQWLIGRHAERSASLDAITR